MILRPTEHRTVRINELIDKSDELVDKRGYLGMPRLRPLARPRNEALEHINLAIYTGSCNTVIRDILLPHSLFPPAPAVTAQDVSPVTTFHPIRFVGDENE